LARPVLSDVLDDGRTFVEFLEKRINLGDDAFFRLGEVTQEVRLEGELGFVGGRRSVAPDQYPQQVVAAPGRVSDLGG